MPTLSSGYQSWQTQPCSHEQTKWARIESLKSLESWMMRKYHVRFGGGWSEKGLTQSSYLACRLPYELTTMPGSVVEALLVAAYQTGRMIKAELVEPKGRRKRGRKPQRVEITVSEPVRYGQLGFEI